MLFNKEYDNSLWLILSGGKVDVESYVDFLKDVPDMLLSLISQSFKWYQVYKKQPDKGITDIESLLSRKIKNEDGLIYWYSINPNNGELEIGETFDTGDDYFNTSIIKLLPVSKQDIENMKVHDEKILGEYEYVYHISKDEEYDYVILDEMVEFTVIKSIFNKTKVETSEILPRYKEKLRIVDVSMMPNELNKEDLKEENFDRKLVRKKMKNSK